MKETGILLAEEGRKVPGFVVALDRRERMLEPNEDDDPGGEPRMSAMGQIKPEYGVETASIVTLDDQIAMLRDEGDEGDIERLEEYKRRYLASN